MHRFFAPLAAPLHISHRGGAALAPENTLLAFGRAVSLYRTDMVELDVHVSADGELVVIHDDTLDRTTDGTGPVAGHTWAELGRLDAGYWWTADGTTYPFRGTGVALPRLTDVLRAFPSLPLTVELKPDQPELAGRLVGALRAEGALDRVCLGCFYDAVGDALVRAAPEACHFFPERALLAFVTAVLSGSAPPPAEPYSMLSMPYRHEGKILVTPRVIDAARESGVWIDVWTIDEARDMRDLLELGVGGILTDRPDVLRAVLDARATPPQEGVFE